MKPGKVDGGRLTGPTSICITILFLLGLLGSMGDLVELYYVLMIVSSNSKWCTNAMLIIFV